MGNAGLTLHSRCQSHSPSVRTGSAKLASSIAYNPLSYANEAQQYGGARRDRTDDLMLAKHALYQLSYGPNIEAAQESVSSVAVYPARVPKELVGPGRLELPTLRLSGVRSNQLSYGPMAATP